jgi:hypothetical protein
MDVHLAVVEGLHHPLIDIYSHHLKAMGGEHCSGGQPNITKPKYTNLLQVSSISAMRNVTVPPPV